MNESQPTVDAALLRLDALPILPRSVVVAEGVEYGLTTVEGSYRLVVLAPDDAPVLATLHGERRPEGSGTLLIGPADAANIAVLREHLPWLRPQPLGLRTSAGMGDRLGLATPGHVRAVRAVGGDIAPIFPQQSIREMTRTGRTAQQVMDDATWGMFAEGWRDGFGADADHLKTPADIDVCVAAGYTFFTIDPGEHVDNRAAEATGALLNELYAQLPWGTLETSADAMVHAYNGQTFYVGAYRISFDATTTLQAAVKYGRAVAHVVTMFRHLRSAIGHRPFELEVSVDETDLPTSHAEHFFIVTELRRLGVEWVSLAPRYVGDFEKGVDYIGDLDIFEADFAVHAAIAASNGPYKLSLHSGSDKFKIYPIAARLTRGLVHLKTAGTSYLEALHTVAEIDPLFFRAIYTFARERYETDRASYHVSARLDRAPMPDQVADDELAAMLDQHDAREILHVTFGSVLRERAADGSLPYYERLMTLLRDHPDAYAANLERHFVRHLRPFVQWKMQ